MICTAVLVAVLFTACLAASAGTEATVDVSAQAAGVIQLSMTEASVNFGGGLLTPRETPYAQPITAVVNSNKAWRITVTKDRNLTGGTESIPSGNLTFTATGPSGKTTYQAPAGTEFGSNTRVVEGTRGNGLSTTITYSLLVPWELEPDTYTASHTYTATQI